MCIFTEVYPNVMDNKEIVNQSKLTAEFYMSRYDVLLHSILKDDNILLSEGVFGKPLYEVMLIGAVSTMEAYLHDRLETIVMNSAQTRQSYISEYNKGRYKNLLDADASDADIMDTFSFHTYHNKFVLKRFFGLYNLGHFIVEQFDACGVSDVVVKRNTLSHNPPRGFIGAQTIILTLKDLREAMTSVKQFILTIECHCMRKGSQRLFCSPEEE